MKKFTIKLSYYVHLLMNQYIAGEREIAKKNRIIFYGQDDLKYDQYYIKEYFKKVSRKKVFEFI